MIGHNPQSRELNMDILHEIVRRIVAVAKPEKIVLFGSRARENYRPDSDIDLLVIQESQQPRYKRAIPLHATLGDLSIEVDTEVMVYTPQEVAEWKTASAAFVTTALREGKVLYEKQP